MLFARTLGVVSVLGLLGSCAEGGTACEADRDCPAQRRCVANVCVAASLDGSLDGDSSAIPADARRAVVLSLEVMPAAGVLSVRPAMPATQRFSAAFRLSDGSTTPASGVRWTATGTQLGAMDSGTGVFTANGLQGGLLTVTAEATSPSTGQPLTGVATLEVRVESTILGPGVSDAVPGHFGSTQPATGTLGAGLAYPLDNAVMPQNVYPADVQWTNGAMGDEFRITLRKPHATITAYLVHSGTGFNNHWLPDVSTWRAFAQTDSDTVAELTVDRYTAGAAYSEAPVHLRFARAALNGSVYYWDIAAGRIIRIDDGTATRNQFMPTPPIDNNQTDHCVGCHAVSPNGRYMAGRLGGGENIGAVFDLTRDLRGNPPPTMFPLVRGFNNTSSARWWFSTWSPDSTRLAVTFDENPMGANQLRVLNPLTGAFLTTRGTALPGHITHPAWAPDNSAIALVSSVDQFGGNNTTGNISVVPVTGADTFGPMRTLHTGTTLASQPEHGNADSYPTWSPDSQLLAFAHGTTSRSQSGVSALYLMSANGMGLRRLDTVNGGLTNNFQPRFAPFQSSEWFWLSFLSRRDYGNNQAGTRGANRQQIWVTAIRRPRPEDPPGMDPSSVPYWLPGQATTSANIAAFWAPRPCRPQGQGCSVGSECCSGDCSPPASGGAAVCSPPPAMQCRHDGETCDTTADCCPGLGLTCTDHVCGITPG